MGHFFTGFFKTADAKTLGKIYAKFRHDPSHLKLYNGLIRQAKSYETRTRALERAANQFYQLGRGSREMVEDADRSRRLAHDSFMSHLTSTARNAAAKGIDVAPMAPYIQDRHRGGEFALDVAKRFRTVGDKK